MQAVKPSDPIASESSTPLPGHLDPAQTLKLLEMELARQRARRLAREDRSGPRAVQVFSVLFLLALLTAGFFALWRVQAMRDEHQHSSSQSSPAAPAASPH